MHCPLGIYRNVQKTRFVGKIAFFDLLSQHSPSCRSFQRDKFSLRGFLCACKTKQPFTALVLLWHQAPFKLRIALKSNSCRTRQIRQKTTLVSHQSTYFLKTLIRRAILYHVFLSPSSLVLLGCHWDTHQIIQHKSLKKHASRPDKGKSGSYYLLLVFS